LLEGVQGFLKQIPTDELAAVFDGWIDRVRWMIARDGQSYGSQMYSAYLRHAP
jgi:hypothetical protein